MTIEQLLDQMKTEMKYEDINLPQAINDIGTNALISVLLENVGNTNSLLRESVLEQLCRLFSDKLINQEQALNIFETCLGDKHLFSGIGGKEENSVFARSFSALIIAHYIDGGLVPKDAFEDVLNIAIEYMQQETDRRGYVMGCGWADAIGHGADLLATIAAHEHLSLEHSERLLDCVKMHITANCAYTHGEEGRLAAVVLPLLDKGMDDHMLFSWLDSLVPRVTTHVHVDESYSAVRVLINIEYFLTALCFKLKPEKAALAEGIRQFSSKIWGKAFRGE